MEKEVAVLIPAHNEEKNIGKLVKSLKERFLNVIIVDDGSEDRTSEIALKYSATVLRHPKCMGKGEALKTGFKYIIDKKIPAVITMDGDGQHLVEDTEKFLKAYRKNKNVGIWIGKRKIISTSMPFIRRLTNVSMSILISLLSFQFIPDTQCGFRLIKREVLERVKLYTSHFETESELLIKASWKGYKIKSIKISTVYGSERSKIKPTIDTLRFFLMIFSLFWRR